MTITGTNIYVLAKYAEAGEIPLRVDAGEHHHLKRCLKAGLCEPNKERTAIAITKAGFDAIAEQAAAFAVWDR